MVVCSHSHLEAFTYVTTSLSTAGGPVSYVQLSQGGFQVVYPLSLWSWFSGVVKVLYGYG